MPKAREKELNGPVRPGPKRSGSGPVGPDQVRAAVVDAAGRLFGERGVDHVSLRDVAEAADVQLALIGRYVGTRDELIDTVFRQVNAQATVDLEASPLQQLPYGRDSTIGRWVALLNYYAVVGKPLPSDGPNPVRTLAATFEAQFGLDHETARRRAAQVGAITLGWRLFEDYLLASAELDDVGLADLRHDLTAIQLQVGSMPWPTPPVR